MHIYISTWQTIWRLNRMILLKLWFVSKLWIFSLPIYTSQFDVLPLCFGKSYYSLSLCYVHLLFLYRIVTAKISWLRVVSFAQRKLYSRQTAYFVWKEYLNLPVADLQMGPICFVWNTQSGHRKLLELPRAVSDIEPQNWPQNPGFRIQV